MLVNGDDVYSIESSCEIEIASMRGYLIMNNDIKSKLEVVSAVSVGLDNKTIS